MCSGCGLNMTGRPPDWLFCNNKDTARSIAITQCSNSNYRRHLSLTAYMINDLKLQKYRGTNVSIKTQGNYTKANSFQFRLVCSSFETVLPFNVYDMIWCDVIRYDVMWYNDMIWYIIYDMIWYMIIRDWGHIFAKSIAVKTNNYTARCIQKDSWYFALENDTQVKMQRN